MNETVTMCGSGQMWMNTSPDSQITPFLPGTEFETSNDGRFWRVKGSEQWYSGAVVTLDHVMSGYPLMFNRRERC